MSLVNLSLGVITEYVVITIEIGRGTQFGSYVVQRVN